MDIGFIWDENKYQEVKRRHGVQFYEVVSAFDDPNGYDIPDPAGHEDRWMWVRITTGGRVLAIIFSQEDLQIYRLITAFDAGRRLRDEYDRRRSGI